MKIRFCGVRGSTAVSGREFERVGGHTSCLAVSVGEGLPNLVLDSGTGIQTLADEFAGRPFQGTILLTHLHWDHVQGLPFFPSADMDDARVVVAQPEQGDAYTVMARAMSPPHFPLMPDGLRGDWRHIGLDAGKHDIEEFQVVAHDVEHKGGRTFGYRVAFGGVSFAYIPDALDANDDAILELADGVDLLVRGTPFTSVDQARADLYGHGTIEHAVAIAEQARAGRLIVTHHAPMRSDDDVEAIAAQNGITAATEGMIVEI